LYHIVSRRHEAKSIVITTNLPFRLWGTIFPGAACVAALVDRFVQHCQVIDIHADSYRQLLSKTDRPSGDEVPVGAESPHALDVYPNQETASHAQDP
jgi:hypothetical protein